MSVDLGATGISRRGGKGSSGSALLIILILLSVMGALMVSNSVTLSRLRVELQMLEQKQKRELESIREPLPPPVKP